MHARRTVVSQTPRSHMCSPSDRLIVVQERCVVSAH